MQLKNARKRLGMTQRDLAKAADVDQRTISRLENWQIAEPSHKVVVRICRALGVKPESIDEFRVNGGH